MKNIKKITAICLCALTVLGLIGSAMLVFASGDKKDDQPIVTIGADQGDAEAEVSEASKDETVYVIASADGGVKKIIVSDWLKNAAKSASLNDKTELINIENVKGEESFELGENDSCVWSAEGNDVYYQGNIEKELPVAIKVSYTLDGKEISPEEIKGKSGRAVIRFDYENKQYQTLEINGKQENIYVPFAALTGMILDNDVFSNVSVKNGKLLNDGDRIALVGIAFPGMQENLGIEKDVFEIPSYFEISADVKDFHMGMSITIATNTVFNKLDLGKLDDLGDLKESVTKLTDAMTQLVDGSSQLYDGLCTLLDKSQGFVDGVGKLADGASALKDGTSELDSGAGQLSDGVSKLSDGLNTIASNNDKLNGGARQVFDSLLGTAKTQLEAAGIEVPALTIENYGKVLDSVIASLDEKKVYDKALETVTQAVEAKRDYIEQQVTAAVKAEVEKAVTEAVKQQVESKVEQAAKQQVEQKVTAAVRENVAEKVIKAAAGMDKASYDAAVSGGMIDDNTQAAVNAAIDQSMEGEEVKQTIAATVESQLGTDEVKALIAQNTEAQMSSEEVKSIISGTVAEKMASDEIKATIAKNTDDQVKKAVSDNMESEEVKTKLAEASEGVKKIAALKSSLDSYNEFYKGLKAYTSGVADASKGAAALKTGASSLKEGTAKISDGAKQLDGGIASLKDGLPELINGITQLRDGSKQLLDGLAQFNEEGVQKLIGVFNGNIEGTLARIKAMMTVSANYRSFSGIPDQMDGSVKFIYKTEGIE